MFETSRDILNLAISLSVLLVAAVLSWFLWQMATTVRNLNRTMSAIQNMIGGVNQLIGLVKEKTSAAGSYLSVLVKSIQQILEFMGKSKNTTGNKRNKT